MGKRDSILSMFFFMMLLLSPTVCTAFESGIDAIEADFWHDVKNIKGGNIKIAIIDSDFDRVDLLGSYALIESFCGGPGQPDCGGPSDHGTKVALVIEEVAPAAEKYLLRTSNPYSLLEALIWCEQNGMDIVNISQSAFPIKFPPWSNPLIDDAGGCDSTSDNCYYEIAEKIRDLYGSGTNNTVVVASSGNYGQHHYAGLFNPDQDNYHQFDEGDNVLNLLNKPQLDLNLSLYLYIASGSTSFKLYKHNIDGIPSIEEVPPSGSGSNKYNFIWDDSIDGLMIEYTGIAAPDPNEGIELYLRGIFPNASFIDPYDPARSITFPAGVDRAIAVGAAEYQAYNQLRDFSSRGPGEGSELIKPDFVGPDGKDYANGELGLVGWDGTSLAAPHVSGAIALLYEAIGFKDYRKVEQYLKTHSFKPMNIPDTKDNEWGYGAIKLRDSYEPNDQFAEAKEIFVGSHEALICCDDDWYKIYLNEGDLLTATIQFTEGFAGVGNLDLALHLDPSAPIEYSDGTNNVETIRTLAESEGWYYLRVYGADYGSGAERNLYSMYVGKAGTPTEIQVNTESNGDQQKPASAALSNGGSIVTWESFGQDGSENGIFGQVFDAFGLPVGDEFMINIVTDNDQARPAVTGLSDGGFVVVWQSYGFYKEVYSTNVKGRVFDDQGNPETDELDINYTTEFAGWPISQCYPSVAGLPDGDFIVTWQSNSQDGDGYGIFCRIFHRNGTPTDGFALGDFPVNISTDGHQTDPSVNTLGNDKFVIVWASKIPYDPNADPLEWEIYAQVFNNDGTMVGTNFNVNSLHEEQQHYPVVCGLPSGNFVVGWESYTSGIGNFDVWFQIINELGEKIGPQRKINTYSSVERSYLSLASNPFNGFIASWSSDHQGDYDVYCQRFDNNGNPIGSEFIVNTYTAYEQFYPFIASFQDNHFSINWNSLHQDGSGLGIYEKIFKIKADLDGDYDVNLADLILGLKTLVALDASDLIRTDYLLSGADVDGNGKLGLEEIIYIIQEEANLR